MPRQAVVCGYCVAVQARRLEKDGVVWNGAVCYARFCGYCVAMQDVVWKRMVWYGMVQYATLGYSLWLLCRNPRRHLEKDDMVWTGAVCCARL